MLRAIPKDDSGEALSPSGRANARAVPTRSPPDPTDSLLALLAAQLDAVERERKRTRNRLRIYTLPADKPDKDGHCRGFGIPADHPAAAVIEKTAQQLEAIEKALTKELTLTFRRHPLHRWRKSMKGVGDKTLARLLGVIGDPYMRPQSIDSKTGEIRPSGPRKPSELWAYCGMHGSGAKRERFKRANWNAEAKMRAFLIVESCIKLHGKPDKNGRARSLSPYRQVYDEARTRYEDKLHTEECKRCGLKGQPAPPGSPWRDGHKHMGAVRIAMKALLVDLWREAKKVHGVAGT